MSTPRAPHRRSGFTLIELVTVLAVIGILVGISLSITRAGSTGQAALRSGQALLNSMLTATRAQAAMRSTNAALIVNTDASDSSRCLRHLVIAVKKGSDWVALDDGIFLPEGVFVVPYNGLSKPLVEKPADWVGLNSSALQTTVTYTSSSTGTKVWNGIALELTSRGTTGNSGNIVLAAGLGAGTSLVLQSPENLRGIKLNTYGISLLADSPASFR